MKNLKLTSLGQIPEADITFGDLTVFVGEQASGKSILLQLVKLILDTDDITRTLKKHGFDWHGKTEHFLSLYFGEGMEKIWSTTATKITMDNEMFELDEVLTKKVQKKAEKSLENLEHRRTYHWISTRRIDSAFAKNSKYGRILRQKSIFGPDSVLNADAVS